MCGPRGAAIRTYCIETDVDTAAYLEHVPKIPCHSRTGERYVAPARIPFGTPGYISRTTKVLRGFYEVFTVWANFYIPDDTCFTYMNV
ncbi:hypothetical protein E2C01_002156 [Portunus trituberculatus]|uniref:Uncharacterized protein n=1 Tax=Portunus trituberculatus TaxID=210409 RepID=A0A5B7CIN0_PORTR|nr:hypothetical protein [Portunus trituberculatus]